MKFKREVRVGLFAAITIAIIVFATVRVGDQSVVAGGAYELFVIFPNAQGLYPKASIEIAGVNVGIVRQVDLTQDGKAQVSMGIRRKVHIPENSKAYLRSRGFLGESYIELLPGDSSLPPLKAGQFITQTEGGGDLSDMIDQFNSIGTDVKAISKTVRGWTDEEQGGAIATTVNNMNDFVKVLREVSVRNEENMNKILENMAGLTHDIREMVQASKSDVENSMDRVASITKKIDEGRGTIGKLINDPDTVEKLNDSLDSLSEALGGYKNMELGLGFHTEYLNRSRDFKNYVSVAFRPTPDEAVLIDLVADPNPDTSREVKTSRVTTGGVTSTVTTDNETLKRDAVLFSAQLAKKLYDFTIRGGIIESKGGVGVDYNRGPLGLQFSAYDFETRHNEQPHLKFMGTVAATRNLYLLGGLDDPMSPQQRTDYFVGAGFQFVDDDIKSLLGLSNLKK